MLSKSSYFKFILLIVLIQLNCKEQKEQESPGQILISNCYITKPVSGNSHAIALKSFEFGIDSLEDFISKFLSSPRDFAYDSTMEYITSFERQKVIYLQSGCKSGLMRPDSMDLMELYFNAGFNTKIMKKSIVEFIRVYEKNIYGFGKGDIYEFALQGVAEFEPHFMYIILKEQREEERRLAKDHLGIIIYSDGLEWQELKEDKMSFPVFVQMIRRSKELYVPLYYDGNRFIPIGHFKGNNWQE